MSLPILTGKTIRKTRIVDAVIDANLAINNSDSARIIANVMTPDKLPRFYNFL